MIRPKRLVRASGVARSLTGRGGHSDLLMCIACERWLPRDAIGFIGRRPVQAGPHMGKTRVYCGECWSKWPNV